MAGVNKVIIVGNLGNDPEVKTLNSGDAATTISVATSENWKDKATGEPREITEWHRIVMFRRLAEIAGQYLRKGSKVYIEGKLKTRKYTDNTGAERYVTEIVADSMQMLDSRGSNNNAGGFAPRENQANGYANNPDFGTPKKAKAPEKAPVSHADIEFNNDDIPF